MLPVPHILAVTLVLATPASALTTPASAPAAPSRAAIATSAQLRVLSGALDRGLGWVETQHDLEVGDLFALQHIQRPAAQQRVASELAARAGTLGAYEGLVRPGALAREPRAAWASLRGHRYEPMAQWLHHAANAPGIPTPERIIRQLARDQHGEYLLAHQYLALRVLSERGVIGGPGIAARLDQLLGDLEAEQRADSQFSDLFAERQALLLWGGRASAETVEWIARIVREQRADGSWPVPPHPYPTMIDEKHVTLVSLWALDEQARRLMASAAPAAAPPAGPASSAAAAAP